MTHFRAIHPLPIYYLDLETIEKIRHKINLDSSERGYHYKGGIEFTLYQVQDFGEEIDERESIIRKADYLLYEIASNQYFICGNKRTGLLVASTFLSINNMYLSASDEQRYLMARAIASKSYDIEEVIDWIRQNLI